MNVTEFVTKAIDIFKRWPNLRNTEVMLRGANDNEAGIYDMNITGLQFGSDPGSRIVINTRAEVYERLYEELPDYDPRRPEPITVKTLLRQTAALRQELALLDAEAVDQFYFMDRMLDEQADKAEAEIHRLATNVFNFAAWVQNERERLPRIFDRTK